MNRNTQNVFPQQVEESYSWNKNLEIPVGAQCSLASTDSIWIFYSRVSEQCEEWSELSESRDTYQETRITLAKHFPLWYQFALVDFRLRYPNLIVLLLLICALAFAGNSVLILLIWLDSRLHTARTFCSAAVRRGPSHISSTVPETVSGHFAGRKLVSYSARPPSASSRPSRPMAVLTLCTRGSQEPQGLSEDGRLRLDGAVVAALVHTIHPMHLPICGSGEINHYFCAVPAILRPSSVDTPG
ncbi:olfactory receptor 2M5-like [Nannospalax galili]|uniref:olfactory receptor 2M5-like n=1 Tax=Nannospalax galili TaxID=1026970 RepID=UPI00111C8D44|nr:olfactory receptor 2M5-like [Nannospalax galili]